MAPNGPGGKDFPPVTGWQFAVAVLSEWRRTVAVIIIILLLGWPMIVIKQWSEEAGVWPSLFGSEFMSRQAEHDIQRKALEDVAHAIDNGVKILERIVAQVQSHDDSSTRKDIIIGHLLLEDCEDKTRSQAQKRRCIRLEKLLERYQAVGHH